MKPIRWTQAASGAAGRANVGLCAESSCSCRTTIPGVVKVVRLVEVTICCRVTTRASRVHRITVISIISCSAVRRRAQPRQITHRSRPVAIHQSTPSAAVSPALRRQRPSTCIHYYYNYYDNYYE